MRGEVLALKRAKSLRRTMSPPEAAVWARLKIRSPENPVFRRQHPLGPYILDFYCAAASLAVEIDGEGHGFGDQPEHDRRRDDWLSEQGVRVVRVTAAELMSDPDEIVEGFRLLELDLSSPVKRGRGTARRVVEGATAHSEPSHAPSTAEPVLGSTFGRARGRSPSPVTTGEEKCRS
ncbi:endonuclease domain-containing protein [Caulobacter segnis]|uniref:endonuclease domain-containing protein n=1 Tax=Caulobacter segnis TaxID=88688 RepID=UPI00240F8A1E|nr:endonuclease domain-containing protein [Caulobacter segnis]MDG2523316.1 endonuclease domain-containing protein [Caulobacter segnis]